jgi:very-short-patch-repair endonuclease
VNRPGAARLRGLLETHRPKSGATRSLLERRLLTRLRAAGVPEPLVNEELRIGDSVLKPDLMWPARRVLVELDGFETHGTRTAQRRDHRRDRVTGLAGWLTLRFTWDDVAQDVGAVVAEIVAAIT